MIRRRFSKAIAEHQTIYIPSGRYIVTDTITLKPDTVLIGLNPTTTQFDIPDSTPAFQGPGSPKRAAGDAEGRHEYCDRHWALYERHQQPGGGGEVDGGQGLADG